MSPSATKTTLQLVTWDRWKHDQWFVFDDRWAAAHPDLAQSLLRYAVHWDPLADELGGGRWGALRKR